MMTNLKVAETRMTRIALLTAAMMLSLATVVSAQAPRSRGPADPRYFPDLYKGPAWGMTLSEYYTFGNKADGMFGYAQHGYREGSNDDILRWKQATGTALPPGYYWQQLRARRAERLGTATPADRPNAQATPAAKPIAARPLSEPRESFEEDEPESTESEASLEKEIEFNEVDAAPALKSSRRNANSRGLLPVDSTQPTKLAGPEQSDVSILSSTKFRRIGSTAPGSGDDKN
jgi:hypothetical protein